MKDADPFDGLDPEDPGPQYDGRSDPGHGERVRLLQSSAVRMGEINANLDAAFLVKGWLPWDGLSVTYGPPGSAKTFWLLDMAIHIAAGEDWHGRRVRSGGRSVVYLIGEGMHGFRNRIAAFRAQLPDLADRAASRFIVQPLSVDLHGPDDHAAVAEWLASESLEPCLIVVDTLARAMGAGDENAARDMSVFVNNVTRLREAVPGGCHVAVIHHSGKDESRGSRGSTALKGAVDCEIRIARGEDGASVATVDKQRDGPVGLSFGYRLAVVELGADPDGAPVTSCVIEECEAQEAGAKLSPNARKFMEALEQFIDDLGTPNPGGTGWPEPGARRIVMHDAFIEWAKGKSGAERERDKRKAARAAVADLIQRGLVQMNEGFIWIIAKGRTA